MMKAAAETINENGNAEATISGEILMRKTMAPVQAHFTHQPFNNMPIAISNWPQAIAGMMIWL